jgi:hypothetical protein
MLFRSGFIKVETENLPSPQEAVAAESFVAELKVYPVPARIASFSSSRMWIPGGGGGADGSPLMPAYFVERKSCQGV